MMKTYGGPLKGGMPLYKYLGNRVLSTFENRMLGMQIVGRGNRCEIRELHAQHAVLEGAQHAISRYLYSGIPPLSGPP